MMYKSMLAAALAATAFAAPALATQEVVSGSGTFSPTISLLAPVEVPGDAFSFYFQLPSTIAANPTTEVSYSKFFLNGVKVADPITSVLFYPVSAPGVLDGGFDLRFAVGGPISLYAADVGSSLTLVPGNYAFTLDDVTPYAGSGTFSIAAVPEPASWALMFVGFGLVGVTLRRRIAKPAIA